ncbi:MAG TPA: ABC transporter permease [Capillimicrobium sp.]|nr:ABC transporter permease [Capillimicrobium sp.]
MRLRDLVAVGADGLRARRLRAALSALGVAIGIASLVAVVGLSESSRADLMAQIDRLGTNLLTVTPGQSFLGDEERLPARAPRTVGGLADVERTAAVTTVEGATARRSEYVDEAETNGIAVMTATPDLLATLGGTMASGRFLDRSTARLPVVVLGALAAERLGLADPHGDETVTIGGRRFALAGVLDPTPLAPEIDRAALVGRPVAHRLFGTTRNPTRLYVRTDPDAVAEARELIAATANPQQPESVEITRPSDALEARAAAKGAFTGLLLGLGGVALLVGGVGIANVMVISVLERRWEVGLRRALGATRREVGAQFLAEAVLLAAGGGIAGAALGALATVTYAGARGWAGVVPPVALAGGVAAAIAIGAVAGLYPAARAARLPPAEALRA